MLVLPKKRTRTWMKIYLWSLQQIRQLDKMDIINGKHIYVGDIESTSNTSTCRYYGHRLKHSFEDVSDERSMTIVL